MYSTGNSMSNSTTEDNRLISYVSWHRNCLSVEVVKSIWAAPYRFAGLECIVLGYRFLGCPVSFCSGFNISLLTEQPP